MAGCLFIGASLALLGYLWPELRMYYSEYQFATRFLQDWSHRLEKSVDIVLPESWNDIRSMTIHPTHWKHVFWLKWIKPPISTHPQGKFHLNILILSWEEEDRRFVVLQYDILEVNGYQNTVWESGQTLSWPYPK